MCQCNPCAFVIFKLDFESISLSLNPPSPPIFSQGNKFLVDPINARLLTLNRTSAVSNNTDVIAIDFLNRNAVTGMDGLAFHGLGAFVARRAQKTLLISFHRPMQWCLPTLVVPTSRLVRVSPRLAGGGECRRQPISGSRRSQLCRLLSLKQPGVVSQRNTQRGARSEVRLCAGPR